MSITEKRLNEIQKRLDAATKGPWNHDVVELRTHISNAVKAPQTDELGTELVVIAHTGYGFGSPHQNASFMAHAREDIPALLAEVERLRALTTVDDAMVERAARAILRNTYGGNVELLSYNAWDIARSDARAALDALREGEA